MAERIHREAGRRLSIGLILGSCLILRELRRCERARQRRKREAATTRRALGEARMGRLTPFAADVELETTLANIDQYPKVLCAVFSSAWTLLVLTNIGQYDVEPPRLVAVCLPTLLPSLLRRG